MEIMVDIVRNKTNSSIVAVWLNQKSTGEILVIMPDGKIGWRVGSLFEEVSEIEFVKLSEKQRLKYIEWLEEEEKVNDGDFVIGNGIASRRNFHISDAIIERARKVPGPEIRYIIKESARHPDGEYVIPKQVFLDFAAAKRLLNTYATHKCWVSSSIVGELRQYFKPRRAHVA